VQWNTVMYAWLISRRGRHHGGRLLDARLEWFDRGDTAQRRACGGHHQRRGQALAHDIAERDGEAARCRRDTSRRSRR